VATVKALRESDKTYPESVETATMALSDSTSKGYTDSETQLNNDKAACAKLEK